MIKNILAVTAAFTLALAQASYAQSAGAIAGDSVSNNGAISQVSVTQAPITGARAGAKAKSRAKARSESTSGVELNQDFSTPSSQTITARQEGTATLKTAPSLGGLALGSGHPCAYSPSSAQFSIIGGGAGYGAMIVDSACMLLLQSVAANDPRAYNAAMYMIAARDKKACEAMRAAGMIDASSCGNQPKQAKPAPVSTRSAVAYAPQAVCTRSGGKMKYSIDAHFTDRAAAKANCKAQLRAN